MNISTNKAARYALLTALWAGLSNPTLAEDAGAQNQLKRNTLELRGSFGGVDTDDRDTFSDLNDIDTVHAAFGYWLNLHQNFSIGLQYLDGESDDIELTFFSLLSDSSLDYNAFLVSAEGRLALGGENYLFARLGASFYDYDIVTDSDNETQDSRDGTDFHVGAGWGKFWGNGLGMELFYEYLPLGSDIEIGTVGAGLTYRF